MLGPVHPAYPTRLSARLNGGHDLKVSPSTIVSCYSPRVNIRVGLESPFFAIRSDLLGSNLHMDEWHSAACQSYHLPSQGRSGIAGTHLPGLAIQQLGLLVCRSPYALAGLVQFPGDAADRTGAYICNPAVKTGAANIDHEAGQIE